MIHANDFRDYRGLYLAHHGIEGQKWGVQNGPPYPLDSKGKARFNERKRKRELKKQDKIIRKQRKEAIKNRRTLSDEELNKLASRIRAENTLSQLVENDQNRGEKVLKEVLANSGKKVLGVATTGAMTYGLYILLKSGAVSDKNTSIADVAKKMKETFDPKEAASYIAPRPKNK